MLPHSLFSLPKLHLDADPKNDFLKSYPIPNRGRHVGVVRNVQLRGIIGNRVVWDQFERDVSLDVINVIVSNNIFCET